MDAKEVVERFRRLVDSDFDFMVFPFDEKEIFELLEKGTRTLHCPYCDTDID